MSLFEKLRFLLFDYEKTTTQEKWRLIARVMCLNAFAVPIIAFASYLVLGEKLSIADGQPNFFLPWDRFFDFFRTSAFMAALEEEASYRIWTWLLVLALGFVRVDFNSKANRIIASAVCWVVIIVPTAIWASAHYIFVPPIFWAGLTWGWLIGKTKAIWPAVFAHALSNAALYVLIKIILLFSPTFFKNL